MVRFPVAESNDVAMRRGPIPSGRGRGTGRTTGRGASVDVPDFAAGFTCRFAGRLGPPIEAPDACVAPFGGSGTPGFTWGRFAGRLGAIFGAPRLTPGFPAVGFGATNVDLATGGAPFTTGFAVDIAGALAAAFGAAFGAAFMGTFAAPFGAEAGTALVGGFAADFVMGFVMGFETDFWVGFDATLDAGFISLGFDPAPFGGTGFVGAGFGWVGFLVGGFFVRGLSAGGFFSGDPLKRRESRPFFSATGGHELHEVRDSAAVAPLVVVPGDHLGKVVAEQHGARRIDDGGPRVAAEIRRDEWLV